MKPDVTSWWQAVLRNDAKYEDGEHQVIELLGVRNRSLKIDIEASFMTFRAMLG